MYIKNPINPPRVFAIMSSTSKHLEFVADISIVINCNISIQRDDNALIRSTLPKVENLLFNIGSRIPIGKNKIKLKPKLFNISLIIGRM
jgi:hypothetical protein